MEELDANKIYGCYRCGAVQGEVINIDDISAICGECHEHGVVTFMQALDLLNDFHRNGDHVEISDEELLEILEELENNNNEEEVA